jgi:hypothetical protein
MRICDVDGQKERLSKQHMKPVSVMSFSPYGKTASTVH